MFSVQSNHGGALEGILGPYKAPEAQNWTILPEFVPSAPEGCFSRGLTFALNPFAISF